MKLPTPAFDSEVSLEKVLHERRSVRAFKDDPLTLVELSQLLWAAQGITGSLGQRTAPSAGALYPLEVFVVASKVQGVEAGVYRYKPKLHELNLVKAGEQMADLTRAALGQAWINEAPAAVVIAGVYERTTGKYGKRGKTYVYIETGHAAENFCLQAVALGLGTTSVGAFSDKQVARVVGLKKQEAPLMIIPVGKPR